MASSLSSSVTGIGSWSFVTVRSTSPPVVISVSSYRPVRSVQTVPVGEKRQRIVPWNGTDVLTPGTSKNSSSTGFSGRGIVSIGL